MQDFYIKIHSKTKIKFKNYLKAGFSIKDRAVKFLEIAEAILLDLITLDLKEPNYIWYRFVLEETSGHAAEIELFLNGIAVGMEKSLNDEIPDRSINDRFERIVS